MNNNGGMDQRVPLVTKASIMVMSFIVAAGLLQITNIFLAHVFLAYTVLFQPPAAIQQSNYNSTGARKKRKKKRPLMKETVEIQTIFVPPTEKDLDHIRRELEMSPIVIDIEDRDAFLVKSIISSTELLMKQRKEELDKAKKEDDELSAAYLLFEKRLAQDTSTTNIAAKNDVDLTIRLKSLMDILGGRTSFKDMDTQTLTILFESAIKELNWLLSMESDQSIDAQHARSTMLLNANNSFFQMLMNGTNTTTEIITNVTCHSYVKLDEGTISNDFIPPKSCPKVSTPPTITKDTARESDLAQYVEQIKNKILVQKDRQRLIEEEIRSMIRPMITSIKEKRQAALVQEKRMRNYWLDKIETLQNEFTTDLSDENGIHNENTADKELCASSDVIRGMVTGGLEALRKQNDPYTAIVEAALGAAVAAGTSDEKMMYLTNEIERMANVVQEIEYTMLKKPPPSKMTKNFIIDGSMLVRGFIGWIDFAVDSMSGYNDSVDSLLDSMVGDEGSVGRIIIAYISKFSNKITFPDYIVRLEEKKRRSREKRAVRIEMEKEVAKIRAVEDALAAEAEAARIAKEMKIAEEAAKAAAKVESARIANELKIAEEAAKAAAEVESARIAEEMMIAEEAAKIAAEAEAARIAEEMRIAEEAAIAKAAAEAAAARIEEEMKIAEEAAKAAAKVESARIAEEMRIAEEAAKVAAEVEEARIAEEMRIAKEAAKIAAEAEAARIAEEMRIAEEAAIAKAAAEAAAARIEEEMKIAEEAAAEAGAARIAEELNH